MVTAEMKDFPNLPLTKLNICNPTVVYADKKMVRCPLCSAELGTVSIYLTHVRIAHASEHGFHTQCGLQGCLRTFRNFCTYHNHVCTVHGLNASCDSEEVEMHSDSEEVEMHGADASASISDTMVVHSTIEIDCLSTLIHPVCYYTKCLTSTIWW